MFNIITVIAYRESTPVQPSMFDVEHFFDPVRASNCIAEIEARTHIEQEGVPVEIRKQRAAYQIIILVDGKTDRYLDEEGHFIQDEIGKLALKLRAKKIEDHDRKKAAKELLHSPLTTMAR